MNRIIRWALSLLLCLSLNNAWAQESFVVKHIEFEGLHRVSPATVESYLPIKRGQLLQPSKTAAILRALYRTGFFEHITLSAEDHTLIIHVTERPTIGQLKISGNSIIPTDKLTSVMKSLDIAEGRVYNPAVLDKITQSLLNQYYLLGRYNARVDVNVTPMTRERVLVKITISEGLAAKIQRISITGNHVFSESTLLHQIDISKSGLFSFITQSDRYSEAKLEMSVDQLRNYYLDRGYLRFNIKSAQAQITPDRKSVYVTIVVDEGELYTIQGYDIQGKLILPRSDYNKVVLVHKGDPFSRKKIVDTEKAMSKLLGDRGYMLASVSVKPQVNDKARTVMVYFEVKPGKRVYVRHVTFSDNTRTNDVVLRREIEQMEGGIASNAKLDQSKHRLNLLPFIKETDMSIKPVENVDDQIDINYKVKEDNSAQATFKVGYSQVAHAILGAGLNQKNFMGTGSTLGLNLQHSNYEQFYSLDYTDPYYTVDGISRTMTLAVSHVNPRAVANLNNGYSSNELDLGMIFGIPVSQEQGVFNRVQAGVIYQDTLINLNAGKVSNQINTFVTRNGRRYQELDFKLGYSRDSRDKAIFPTSGSIQTAFVDAFAPITNESVSFYTFNYHGKLYQPITDEFIFLTKGDFGYGNGFHGIRTFPFFRNYFAGGFDSVRGYQGYTLGPRDSNFQAYGGNILLDGSVGLIFPNYLSDSLRTSVFFDAGNVYSSANNKGFGCSPSGKTCSTNSGPIRYSTGLEADLITPFGPIGLSLAKPLNLRKGDDQEIFQFSLGANF